MVTSNNKAARLLASALLIIAGLLLTPPAMAYDFASENSDGVMIYYNFTDTGCEVTSCREYGEPNSYSGDIVIPEYVTYNYKLYFIRGIGEEAFYNWTDITSVSLPQYVTYIADKAFFRCNLSEITIPQNVTSIGANAFSANNLLKVTSLNPEPPACGDSPFPTYDAVLYVPIGSKEAYSTADVWKKFTTITQIDVILPTVTTLAATDVSPHTAVLHGSVIAGNEEIREVGFEYWNDNTPVVTVPVDIAEAISAEIDNLPASTLYSYRAYAITEEGTTYGEARTLTTSDIFSPTAITLDATEITYSTAVLNGIIVAGNEELLEVGFEYWGDDSAALIVPVDIAEEISAQIDNLKEWTQYTYRAYATTLTGTTYGGTKTFTTNDIGAPIVTTLEPTNVKKDSAVLHGTVVEGDEEITGQGFELWQEGGNTITSFITQADNGSFGTAAMSLTEGTVYLYHAYATTANGTFYGEDVSFTTLTDAIPDPVVTTLEPTDITINSAVLHGSVVEGTDALTGQGFELWQEGGNTITSFITQADNGSFGASATALTEGTVYLYHAYATTANGTFYGEDVSFTTLVDGIASVPSAAATVVGYSLLDGQQVSAPQRGVTIVRLSDGTTKKVLVK